MPNPYDYSPKVQTIINSAIPTCCREIEWETEYKRRLWEAIKVNHSGFMDTIEFMLETSCFTTVGRIQNAVYNVMFKEDDEKYLFWEYIYECYHRAGVPPHVQFMSFIENRIPLHMRRPYYSIPENFPDILSGICLVIQRPVEKVESFDDDGNSLPIDLPIIEFTLEFPNHVMYDYVRQEEELNSLFKSVMEYFRNLRKVEKVRIGDCVFEAEQVVESMSWIITLRLPCEIIFNDNIVDTRPAIILRRK